MDFSASATKDAPDTDAIIVKADEVDESGADISTISPTNTSSESDFNDRIESRRAQDAQSAGSPKVLANAVPSPPRANARPVLKRESSAPAPPPQRARRLPPLKQAEALKLEEGNASDSLSLQQLKRLVGDLPKVDHTAYAYEYEETRSFPEELQEWFQYIEEDNVILLRSKEDFDDHWVNKTAAGSDSRSPGRNWIDASDDQMKEYVEEAVGNLESEEASKKVTNLGRLAYIALGAWYETAGLGNGDENASIPPSAIKWSESQSTKSSLQLRWIIKGTKLLFHHGIVPILVHVLKIYSDREQSVSRELSLPRPDQPVSRVY